MSKNPFGKRILLASPKMHTEELEFVKEAFDRNWIAPLGFNCDSFERETAAYLGNSMNALALSSGTAALHLAVKLAGVKPGDKVFCSDMTFSATVNPVSYEFAEQVFIDSEPETWNMDPEALEKAFEKYPNTKVVILAHLYGTPAKINEIRAICDAHDAVLIEDAAEALSSTYQNGFCGTFGNIGVLSFNGNKIITTSGGGMLLTRTREQRDKALFWATQSREPAPWYQHEELGYNYRMSNVVAGIGRGQIRHIAEHRAQKEKIYRTYQDAFAGLPLIMNPHLLDSQPNYWLSCILLKSDAKIGFMDILNALNNVDIESRPIWKPMHMQPYYAARDFITTQNAPLDEVIFARGLCLPSDLNMSEDEQAFVIETVKKCFR